MRQIRMAISTIMVASLLIPVTTFASDEPDKPFDRIVGFGDSLSDPGNHFFITGQQSFAPFAPVPDASYPVGGHHFSNGETWLEQLAKAFDDPLGGNPAFKPNQNFSNYAFGGARARSAGVAPNLSIQVASYLSDNGGVADSDALHVIWLGANDLRDMLTMLQTATTNEDLAAAYGVLMDALLAIGGNISALHSAGARSFLVANQPNLGILPAIRAGGPDAAAAAYFFSDTFNSELSDILNQLEALPGIEISRLDVWALLNSVYIDPTSFGLENSQIPCLRFGVTGDMFCDNPQDYLFWDAIHPTASAHGILANTAFSLLTLP